MEQKELCIRCNKPTPYHPDTPIMLRRYYVEGSGQLCEKCFYELYPVPGALRSKINACSIPAKGCLEHEDGPKE